MGRKFRPGKSSGSQAGFTYVGVLVAVAVSGVMLMAGADLWTAGRERDTLRETRWRGEQYARAIKSYEAASVGSEALRPNSLQDLVIDHRYIGMKRHIRRLYDNPSSSTGKWELVRDERGAIAAVAAEVTVGGEKRREQFGEWPRRVSGRPQN